MPRYIDADALIRRWCGIKCGCERDECGREIEPCIVVMAIEEAMTIDAVPVVHGKWIYEGARGRFPACRCSVCGNVENADWAMISGEVNYCPNCGADMRGEQDE